MPAAFHIDPVDQVVYSRAWGVLTDRDLADTRAAMAQHPAFAPSSSLLYDFSEVTAIQVTAEGIRTLAQSSPFATTARRAMVAPSDLAYGMLRMFALLSNRDERNFRIFRERAAAVAWLTGPPA